MPQPTSINFWKINRHLQEESRILREAFKKISKNQEKSFVLKRRWSPSNHQTRSAIAENLQRLSVRQSLEQTSYAAERPRIPLAFVRAVAPWLHLHTGLLEPNIAHRALTNREPFRNAVCCVALHR